MQTEKKLSALKNELPSAESLIDLFKLFDRFVWKGDPEVRKERLGRTSYVVTAKGDEVETGFKLIEASEIVPSNTLDGRINPDFPAELQPRDRTRASSINQVAKISSNLRPAQLSDSGLSSHGAPIVGRDNVVESGNGRTMAIQKAYADGKADDYKDYLINNAEMYGLKRSDVESMTMPILVRERVTDLDRAAFARDSNLSDLQSMSAAETAWVDSEMIDDQLMGLFNPSETGNLLAKSNDAFINKFLTEIGDNSTAGLLTADGRPTKQLLDRVQNAIFAKAYKNDKLVKLVAEEPDPEIRNILNAMNGAAPAFVQMQYLSGEAHKQASESLVSAIDGYEPSNDPDIANEALNALVGATELVRKARDSGQDLEELISQADIFNERDPITDALAKFISANNRSSKRLSKAFKAMAEEINKELQHQGQGMDMFGGGTVTLIEILSRASQALEMEENGGQGMMMGLFESVAQIDEAANQAATSPLNNLNEPTNNQKIAGNYKKGRVVFSGLNIAIENPKGSTRKGTDSNGEIWEVKINNHYGDITGTIGADGDPIDVFLGENEDAEYVYIIHQVDPATNLFDEDKVMLGFDSESDAKSAYLSNYEDNWKGFGSMTTLSLFEFKDKLKMTENGKQVSFYESIESKSFTSLERFLALTAQR